jgi:hypoxanthine phosphoribosyltransferase
MRVIFINGVAGSGKTTYAKKIADGLKMDYYVSSSNNDALGGYKGQKVLILDDARDSTFSFNDFLKLLDNHTSSSVRSRYNNKVFNGEIIIITSVIPLYEWYSGIDSKISQESKTQLYRRINEYYEMDKDTIKAYNGLNDKGMPNLLKETVIPNFITAMFEDSPSKTLSIFAKTLKVFEDDATVGPLLKKKLAQIKKTKLPF